MARRRRVDRHLALGAAEEAPVDEDANPFAPPRKPVPPREGKRSCLTPEGARPGGADGPSAAKGAACKVNDKCKALEGDCCPNGAGDFLSCCG